MDNFIFLPARSRKNAGNSATGKLSVALGQHCTASGEYSFADGSGCIASTACSVALGNAADASNTCGFMYKDICDNTFCFDSGGQNGSAHIKINDSIVALPTNSYGEATGYGYKVIDFFSPFNDTSCSVLDVTGLSATALSNNSRCKVTIIGAGGAGGGAPDYAGGGGGGGASATLQIFGNEGWDSSGFLHLGEGGYGYPKPNYVPGVMYDGDDSYWRAVLISPFVVGGGTRGGSANPPIHGSGGTPPIPQYGSANAPYVPPGVGFWSFVEGLYGASGFMDTHNIDMYEHQHLAGGRGGSAPSSMTRGTPTAPGTYGGGSMSNIVFKGGYGAIDDGQSGLRKSNFDDGNGLPPVPWIGGGGGGGWGMEYGGNTGGAGGNACMFIEWWL